METVGIESQNSATASEVRTLPMLQERGKWGEWVDTMLEQAEDGFPTQERLAAVLNVTPRTLCRYLTREGSSFRKILASARIRRSRALLINSNMAISDIAYALGYTDLASFSRSFKRTHGVCPSDYRMSHRAKPQLRTA